MTPPKKILRFSISFPSKMKYLSILLALMFFYSSSTYTFSQTNSKQPKLGSLFLTKEYYSKLPKPNWDTLIKYSNVKTRPEKGAKSIVTLVTPPIGNQGNQGSCTGWAVGYAGLGTLTFPKYNCWDVATRSPNYIFNQIKINGCDSGAYLFNAVVLASQQGSCSWSLMPYNESECSTQPNMVQSFEASKHNVTNYYAISPTTNLGQIKQALDLGYPVPCGISVYDSFYECWFDDGIWDRANSGSYRGGHAVCIIGYDDVQQMVKVQNSWGPENGDEGFFWIPYSRIQSGCLEEAYIISGMDPSYPQSILGSPTLCSSALSFSIVNDQSTCGISWTCSNNVSRISSQGSNPCSFQGNGTGVGWIEATLNTGCSTSFTLARYYVQVNPPINYTSIDFLQDCNMVDLTINIPTSTTVTWTATSNFLLDGYSSPFTKLGNSITITSNNGMGGTVSGVTDIGCSVTTYSEFTPCLPWDGQINWIWACPAPGEPLVGEVSPLLQNAYEYRWFIGNELIETTLDGYLSSYNWQCTSAMPSIWVAAVTSTGQSELKYGGDFFPACDRKLESNVKLYPNPATDQVTIELEETNNSTDPMKKTNYRNYLSEITRITVIDKLGISRKVTDFGKGNKSVYFNVSELTPGLYYLDIMDGVKKVRVPVLINR
jgi:hypothetical protein